MKKITRPNILLIYTDQQRSDSLRCYGNDQAISPNIDKLASEGARFDHFYTQSPVCMPSRMSFLTGRYPSSIGVGTNGISIPEREVPVNQLLAPYGYDTAQIGKLHFKPHAKRDSKDPHPTYGFDTFILSDEPGCYDDAYTKWVESIDSAQLKLVRSSLPPAAEHYNKPAYSEIPRGTHLPYLFQGDESFTHSSFVASEICSYLSRPKNDPFFAIAGFFSPHSPVNPPDKFVKMFDIDKMPLPIKGKNEQIYDFLKDITPDEWKKIKAYYYALCTHVDDCVGSILDTLEQTSLAQDTIVIFTTDHGEYLGDHGRVYKSMPGHDCISRVPFIMRYPGVITANTLITDMVEAVDFTPTILDYAGIQTPHFVQGRSLKNTLSGTEQNPKNEIIIETFSPDNKRITTVKTKDFMYSCYMNGEETLYDRQKDPNEINNVINDSKYKDTLSDMRLKMILKLEKVIDSSNELEAEY